MIASFQIPNQNVLDLIFQNKKVTAIKAWRSQDHKLLNGVRVRPRLKECMAMIRCVEAGLSEFPMAIPMDGYVLRPSIHQIVEQQECEI